MSEKQEGLTDEQIFLGKHWRRIGYYDDPWPFRAEFTLDSEAKLNVHNCPKGHAAAAEFTRERCEEIRQIEREIEILELALPLRLDSIEDHLLAAVEATPRLGRDFATLSRILKREQDALAALQRGMLPSAPAKETKEGVD